MREATLHMRLATAQLTGVKPQRTETGFRCCPAIEEQDAVKDGARAHRAEMVESNVHRYMFVLSWKEIGRAHV